MSAVDLVIEKLQNNPEGWLEYEGNLLFGVGQISNLVEESRAFRKAFRIERTFARYAFERPFDKLVSPTASYKLGYFESWKLGRAVTKWRAVSVQSSLIEAMITGELK